RPLRLGHRLALGLRGRVVLARGDWLCFGDLPRLVIDDDLGELVALHRVYGELQLAVLDLVLPGDWLPFFGARREATLQRDLGVLQRLGQLGVLLVIRLLRPARRHREEPGHEECERDRRLSHWCFSMVTT